MTAMVTDSPRHLVSKTVAAMQTRLSDVADDVDWLDPDRPFFLDEVRSLLG